MTKIHKMHLIFWECSFRILVVQKLILVELVNNASGGLTSLGNKPLKALKTDMSGKIWKEKKSEYNQLVSHNTTPNRSANEKTIRGGVAKQAFVRRGHLRPQQLSDGCPFEEKPASWKPVRMTFCYISSGKLLCLCNFVKCFRPFDLRKNELSSVL